MSADAYPFRGFISGFGGFISGFEAVLPVLRLHFRFATGSYRRLPPPPRLLSLGEYETLRRRLDDLRFRELPSELSSDELPVDEDEYFRFRRICSLEDLLLGLRDLQKIFFVKTGILT